MSYLPSLPSLKTVHSFVRSFFDSKHDLHKVMTKEHREKIRSLKAKIDARRTMSEKIADFLTEAFGTVFFLGFNAFVFLVWIVLNMGIIPSIPVFDPFPYGLLTMAVSLEAIFLAIIVLISQNRAAHVAELREEIDLQINVQAEEEITKILILLDRIHDHLGLPPEDDEELIRMKQKTDLDKIEQDLALEMLRKE